jgi:hypothetical protein
MRLLSSDHITINVCRMCVISQHVYAVELKLEAVSTCEICGIMYGMGHL